MSAMFSVWTSLEIAEGIVLIDEIEAHLHPRWKLRIVSGLRRAFPRIQFIVTSHDPLCLRGVHEGEVTVMRQDHNGIPYSLDDLPSPSALRVDQLLTSELFGLSTTDDNETEENFARYYELLVPRNRRGAQKEGGDVAREQLKRAGLIGQNRRERLMLEAIDTFLARERYEASSSRRQRLSAALRRELQRAWES